MTFSSTSPPPKWSRQNVVARRSAFSRCPSRTRGDWLRLPSKSMYSVAESEPPHEPKNSTATQARTTRGNALRQTMTLITLRRAE